MNRLLACILLTLASTVAAPPLVSAAPDPASVQVPDGDLAQLLPGGTMVFASVQELGKAWLLDPDGAIRELLAEDAVHQAFESAFDVFADFESQEFLLALDLEEEELGRLFQGRVMLAIPEIVLTESEASANGSSSVDVTLSLEMGRGMVLMADFGGTRDRLEELLANITSYREDNPAVHTSQVVDYEYEGLRLYNIEELDTDMEVDDSTWLTLVDGLLMASNREETLKDFADLARNGAPEGDRLSEDPRYREALEQVGPHDVLLYVNLGELLPLVNQLIEQQINKQGLMLAAFLRAEDLIAALGLDAIKSLFAGLKINDDEAGLVFGFTHADTDLGLHTLLTYGDGGVEIPPYFSSDFHSASITRFDLSAAYEAFDKLLLKASPTGHNMLQGQIERAKSEGLDLIDGLLSNLDSLFVEVLGYPESTVAGPQDFPTQAYVVKVKDPQSLQATLDQIVANSGQNQDEPIEFMNEQIRVMTLPVSFPPGSGNSSLAYAVVENSLIVSIGQVKMVENLISHIKNPGESLLDDPDLMDAFDALPGDDVVALGFVNVADLLSNLIRGGDGVLSARIQVPAPPDDLERLLDAQQALDALPDVTDIRYYIVSKTFRSPEAFVQRMLLRPNL